jgi:hypothetical protein
MSTNAMGSASGKRWAASITSSPHEARAGGAGENKGASTSAFSSATYRLAQRLDLQARNAVALTMEQIEDLWAYVRTHAYQQ